MKKLALCALIGAIPMGSAFAQSNVTIYGVFDIAAYYSAHQYNQDPQVPAPADPQVAKFASGHVVGLTNAGETFSQLGFKGSEDLGDGLRAVFVLEDRFNPNNGVIGSGAGSVTDYGPGKIPLTTGGPSSLDGQLFNGQANAGLASATLGTVVFGRVTDFGAAVIGATDPMHGSATFSPMGYSGVYAGIGFTDDARLDNSVKYSNKTGDFNYGLIYKFGGQSGVPAAQSAVQATFGYNNGPLNIQGAIAKNTDNFTLGASGVAGTVDAVWGNTQGGILGASYALGDFTLSGGFEEYTFNTPSNPAVDALTSSVYGQYTVTANNTTAYAHERKLNFEWLGLGYSITPKWTVTGAVYWAHQNDYSGGACATNGNATSTCAGNSEFISAMTDYSFSKRTDVYAGYMLNKVTGGFDSAGTLNSVNYLFGAGIRHQF